MKAEKFIGLNFITGAIGVFVPYTILTITFHYPDMLREDPGVILTEFHGGGASLILTWWLFAILGMPLILAYQRLGQILETQATYVRFATTIGIIGLILQMVGLLRWAFVVPILANQYMAGDPIVQAVTKIVFEAVHQYGGVVLGEHLGQLFTIIWTILLTATLRQTRMFPKWIIWLGYLASFVYLLAQAELFVTVIPNFPMWDLAGFLGSSLWLVWLLVLGVQLFSNRHELQG